MRMTFSIPQDLAQRFLATVPDRERSKTIAKLLEGELGKRDTALASACRAANADEALNAEIAEWQEMSDSFEE